MSSPLAKRELTEQTGKATLVHCPACGQVCREAPVYKYSAAQAAAHFCPVTRDQERYRRLQECIRRLWQADECVVHRCTDCGFGFGLPFVSGDEEFYALLHETKNYPAWRWDYDVARSEALRNFKGGRILDIGAGSGAFLRRLGSNWECFAVEASDATRSELEAAGVKVFRNLSQLSLTRAGSFQVVTLFQVLEHIADFNPLLQQCRELLQTGGFIVITVPDADAMVRQQVFTGCHDMPPNHINKWTPLSLKRVLNQAGFQVGHSISERASWSNLKASLHMRVMADATNKASLAAQAYRIRNRPLRIAALSFLGVPAFLRMLPNSIELRKGGAFGMIGVAH